MLLCEGDSRSIEKLLEEAPDHYREINNRRGQAQALSWLAFSALDRNHAAAARQIRISLTAYGEMLQLAQQPEGDLAPPDETVLPD